MSCKVTVAQIGKMIDHSLLTPTLTEAQLTAGCELAAKYDCASVCVKPYHVKLAKQLLAETDVLVGAVIGFPAGNSTVEMKVTEAKSVVADGAVEVDMVINISKALEEDWAYLEREIGAVVEASHAGGAAVKVIFAVDYLEDKHIVKLCEICGKVRADWVKTSTGYNYVKDADGRLYYEGATDHRLELMRKSSPEHVQVKAAGCRRTLRDVLGARCNFGVTRVGTGSTEKIMDDALALADENGVIHPPAEWAEEDAPGGY
jgi:deoxyribose-phosphate aldolase